MAEARFYHLTQRGLAETVSLLLSRALSEGWRVTLRGIDDRALAQLDDALWVNPPDGFLPHGRSGGAEDARQPVLLTSGPGLPNAPDCLMCLHGVEVAAEEVQGLKRVFVLFDGGDPEAVSQARMQWKTLTDAGIAAQYWNDEGGRWQMKSERKVQE